jgi:hypothetical protein
MLLQVPSLETNTSIADDTTTALKQDASRAVAVAVVAMDTNVDCLMDRF